MKKLATYILIMMVCAIGICGCGKKAEAPDNESPDIASAESDTAPEESEAVPEDPEESDEGSGEEGGEGKVDFSGSYTEPDTGRCLIEISKESEESFTITVNWANDASEERIWAIT